MCSIRTYTLYILQVDGYAPRMDLYGETPHVEALLIVELHKIRMCVCMYVCMYVRMLWSSTKPSWSSVVELHWM